MNAAFNALRWILEDAAPAQESKIKLLDYRDETTFRDLWLKGLESDGPTINGTEFNWHDADQQILIVGNDPPIGAFDKRPTSLKGINFNGHFTATSWVAAWKVKFMPAEKEKQSGKMEPIVRVAVIDPRESIFASGTARALQTILGARDTFDLSLIPGATVLNTPGLDAICHWLRDSRTDLRPAAPHQVDLLRSTIWNELTSDRGRNHALSNVLGALLLMAQVGPPGFLAQKFKLPAQEILLSLVRACGGKASDAGEKSDSSTAWISESLHREIAGAVLLDDMSDLWTPFLAVALGFYGPSYSRFVSVQAGDFPAMLRGLPQRLEAVLARGANARITAADLIPGEHKLTDDFVLFLDLRLFAGQGRDSDERSFCEALAEFGIKLIDSDRNLPWLVTEHAKAELRAELGQCRQSNPLKNCETLLPRLIALLDPTLPVVIFSSTHRSELIDAFRNCGNVITTFRKPILEGMCSDWTDMTMELRADFLSSLECAVRVLAIRKKIQMIETMRQSASHMMVLDAGEAHHVEIFLDEGTGELAPVGGLFAVFEGATLEAAQAKAQHFDDGLVRAGVRYFDSHGIGPQPPAGSKAKGDECLAELAKVCNTGARPKYLGALRVRLKQTDVSALPQSSTFDQFDQEWFGGLEAVIELFVGEWLGSAQCGRAAKTSMGIYVAGRSAPPSVAGDIGKARYRAGWETTNNLIQTFNRRDCWRIARAILEVRKAVTDLDRAVGVSLVYEMTPTGFPKRASEWTLRHRRLSIKADGSTAEIMTKLRDIESDISRWRPDYPALLYAADASLKKWGNWSKYLAPYAADLHLNESLVRIANAGRSLDNGKVAECLLLFPVNITDDNRSIASLLAARLLHRVARISHIELRHAFDLINKNIQ